MSNDVSKLIEELEALLNRASENRFSEDSDTEIDGAELVAAVVERLADPKK